MRKFIVAINDSTKRQNYDFIEFIQDNDMYWWHWIDNFWIIIDPDDTFTSAEIREIVNEIFGAKNNLVIRFQKKGWSGYGPKSDDPDGKNMFKWLKRNL